MYRLPNMFLALCLVLLRGIRAEGGALAALTVAIKMLGIIKLTLRYKCYMYMQGLQKRKGSLVGRARHIGPNR